MNGHTPPNRDGTGLVICDSCGGQFYENECKPTWDGLFVCTVKNCWYSKHPLFEIPPTINDPKPLTNPRPDVILTQLPEVSDIEQVGKTSTWDHITNPVATNGRLKWNEAHVKWGQIDTPRSLINLD